MEKSGKRECGLKKTDVGGSRESFKLNQERGRIYLRFFSIEAELH
jgi:hypothetical protein